MPLLQLSGVSLAYGHVPLLDRVDFVLEASERVGLIGRNGTGKSTLLRVISGSARADDGKTWLASDLRMAFVEQEPAFTGAQTVFDAVADGVGAAAQLLIRYHHAAHAVAVDASDAAMHALQEAQEALEAGGGWTLEHRVESIVSRLGLPAESRVGELSGGLKKRVALARALVGEPQLLLLDEPTNHLDITGIEWLEDLLVGFAGSVLFVTHDRRFLDRVATRIAELDRGRLLDYPGNFSAYEQRKAEQLAVEAVENRKFDKLLAQEEAWIRKGVEARRTRNEGRVRRLDSLRAERAARRNRIGQVDLAVSEGERSGRLVAELEGVSKRYGDKRVVEDFSGRIMRGDKVGFIGPNGTGKSTLLKLILGEIAPDTGHVRMGSKVQVAYYDQFRTALDEEATLADTISPGSDVLEIGGTRKHVISYLGDFLFPPERARAPVKSLSGGERNRLLLARLFSRPANVLVLDEPTNDLDIETLELLESLLQEYDGTILLVSHDRAFIDNVVTQTIAFEGEGRWKEYAGGYADWLRARSVIPVETGSQPKVQSPSPPKRSAKLSFKESRELEALPARIEALEAEQKSLAEKLADSATYTDRATDVAALNKRHDEIDAELTALLARWEELEGKRG